MIAIIALSPTHSNFSGEMAAGIHRERDRKIESYKIYRRFVVRRETNVCVG